ncbi:hypothetical protein HII31_07715 [Pseudocercospora fuligena]|uniref:Zn(2)-C6 fungal-type domain-containing protein n=1 Tax=Pseudocercospora fuligena TaxID=685502 RepID=A0A8H6RGB8_9PEZI|nr:hypothetical protein HII31_07715 [Pseudocercospora fuligena]
MRSQCMFASFELRPEGLAPAEPRQKLLRDAEGCLPCRRKRKRCDKTRPACLRCRNSTNRDTCTWPEVIKNRRTRSVERDESPAAGSSHASESMGVPSALCKRREQQSDWTLQSTALIPNELGALSPIALPESVSRVSPELSFTNLVEMSLAFQRKVLCGQDVHEPSILLLALQSTGLSSATLHAWAASSIAAVAPPSPEWQQKALQHHSHALQDLRRGIEVGVETAAVDVMLSDEWKMATVLMLHIFESFSVEYGNVELATAHLHAAHRIFAVSLMRDVAPSRHDLLLLEAYILRTALNCLPEAGTPLPLDYMSFLLRHFKSGLTEHKLEFNVGDCPWIGYLGDDLLDKMYRLSWLAHKLPLRSERLAEGIAISRFFGEWTEPTAYYADAEDWARSEYHIQARRLLKAHLIACRLMSKLVLAPDANMEVLQEHENLNKGVALLDQVCQRVEMTASVLWPLLIFSMLISTPFELETCQMIASRAVRCAGPGVVKHLLALQEDIFALRSSNGCILVSDMLRLVTSNSVFL